MPCPYKTIVINKSDDNNSINRIFPAATSLQKPVIPKPEIRIQINLKLMNQEDKQYFNVFRFYLLSL